jgi:hypothetical protein
MPGLSAELTQSNCPQIKKAAAQAKVLQDDRFSALFKQKEFEIDTSTAEYKLLHPSEFAKAAKSDKPVADDDNFDAVEGLDSDDSAHEDASGDEAPDVAALAGASRKVQNGQWGNTSTKGSGKKSGKSKMSQRNQLTMFEVRGGHEAAVLRPTPAEAAPAGGGKRAKTLTLADRLASGASGKEAQVCHWRAVFRLSPIGFRFRDSD